jgi:type I pantothenate kinase
MNAGQADGTSLSPFVRFSREEWSRLHGRTPLSLSEADMRDLRRINEHVSLEEVTRVYLLLSWLLELHVVAVRNLYEATRTFLGSEAAEVPYIIGIAGSVAVGKSTIAQVLQALISRWPDRPKVDLITTDGFLYPNRVLKSRGLMNRKGFPESYDLPLLLRFLADIKSGRAEVSAPIHSHLTYDILPDQAQFIRRPDVVIVEGLNILEAGISEPSEGQRILSPITSTSPSTWTRRRDTSGSGTWGVFCACERWHWGITPHTSTAMRASPWRRLKRWPDVYGTRSTTPTSKRTSNPPKTGHT